MSPESEKDLGFILGSITWYLKMCFICFLIIMLAPFWAPNKKGQFTREQIRATQHYSEPLFEKCIRDKNNVISLRFKNDYCIEHMMEYKTN